MRPPSFPLSFTAILTLPHRLCNPPPAAGNVRSCKVTPLIKVSLDDVLNKRHLPPLTLKDFEEWLVFVEGCPQYLYFILWLKEYESRYAAWLAKSGCTSPDLSYIHLIPASPPLALFFTRAKQTFLDPSSPHALGPSIPPQVAPHPHPHPHALVPLAAFCRAALQPRIERFAQTACRNVGTRRAWCGVVGGSALALLCGVLPALVALFCARARWWRVVGWLGCWVGGTVLVSSFHGICVLIYAFGDLRQLRSFELARPAISPPRAIARARPRLQDSPATSTPRPRIPTTPHHESTGIRPAALASHASTEQSGGIEVSSAYYYPEEKARALSMDVAAAGSESWARSENSAKRSVGSVGEVADDSQAGEAALGPRTPPPVLYTPPHAETPRQWWDTCPRHPAVVDALPPVPSFAPVTRVLSPLAARGQWEIVVRSACVAALGAWVVVGCIVAVPATGV